MESLLSIWARRPEWEKYPHLFRSHDSMKAEAESYAASLSGYGERERRFIVRGHMAGARSEWEALLFEGEREPRPVEAADPGAWLEMAGANEETATRYGARFNRGVCAGGHHDGAVALHYFAGYVAQALANFGVEWMGAETVTLPRGLNLPPKLDTPEARRAFPLAIDMGWMRPKPGGGFEWLGVCEEGTKGQLAYFLGKVYGYEWVKTGIREGLNKGKQLPQDDLAALFSVAGRFSTDLARVYTAAKPQPWRATIDEIFK